MPSDPKIIESVEDFALKLWVERDGAELIRMVAADRAAVRAEERAKARELAEKVRNWAADVTHIEPTATYIRSANIDALIAEVYGDE